MSRHVRHSLIAAGIGLFLTTGLLVFSGSKLAYIGLLVLIFTLVWPTLGVSGNLLARAEQWPLSRNAMPWMRLGLLAILLTIIGQSMRLVITWQPTHQVVDIADTVSSGGAISAICFFGFMLLMAVYEEMVFRHFLLPWMTRTFRQWTSDRAAMILAVMTNCGLFALWHADMMDPAWMKPAQTFVYGLGFCWARILYSSRAAIFTHIALNATVIVTTLLMTGASAI